MATVGFVLLVQCMFFSKLVVSLGVGLAIGAAGSVGVGVLSAAFGS